MRISIVSKVGYAMRPENLMGLCTGYGKTEANSVYCHRYGKLMRYYPCIEYYLVKVLEVGEVR